MDVPSRTVNGESISFDVALLVKQVIEGQAKEEIMSCGLPAFIGAFKMHVYPLPSEVLMIDIIKNMPGMILVNGDGKTVQVKDFDINDGKLRFQADVDLNEVPEIVENIPVTVFAAAMMIFIRRKWVEEYDSHGFTV